MRRTSERVHAQQSPTPVLMGVAAGLRTVVLQHADRCFLDTDGVTRDASRMLQIMDGWRPNRSDGEAGVRRNAAFAPDLEVVVTSDLRICYPPDVKRRSGPALLFTIVPPERV